MEKQSEVGGGPKRPTLVAQAFSAARVAANKCHVNFKERQKRDLVWMALVAFALIQSYFVRELLVAPHPAVKSGLVQARLEMRKHLNRCLKREGQAVPSCTVSAEGKQKELDNARTISSTRA
jgi:hypothetical protein